MAGIAFAENVKCRGYNKREDACDCIFRVIEVFVTDAFYNTNNEVDAEVNKLGTTAIVIVAAVCNVTPKHNQDINRCYRLEVYWKRKVAD